MESREPKKSTKKSLNFFGELIYYKKDITLNTQEMQLSHLSVFQNGQHIVNVKYKLTHVSELNQK